MSHLTLPQPPRAQRAEAASSEARFADGASLPYKEGVGSLHTRGYRPKPGERSQKKRGDVHGPTVVQFWRRRWRRARIGERGWDYPWDQLAVTCLDARLAPGPLVWAQAARIIRVSGLGQGNGDRLAPGLVRARRNARRS